MPQPLIHSLEIFNMKHEMNHYAVTSTCKQAMSMFYINFMLNFKTMQICRQYTKKIINDISLK